MVPAAAHARNASEEACGSQTDLCERFQPAHGLQQVILRYVAQKREEYAQNWAGDHARNDEGVRDAQKAGALQTSGSQTGKRAGRELSDIPRCN